MANPPLPYSLPAGQLTCETCRFAQHVTGTMFQCRFNPVRAGGFPTIDGRVGWCRKHEARG